MYPTQSRSGVVGVPTRLHSMSAVQLLTDLFLQSGYYSAVQSPIALLLPSTSVACFLPVQLVVYGMQKSSMN
jgi:hypothetical protein